MSLSEQGRDSEHDLLIRIDENLKNLLDSFETHQKSDKDSFASHEDRLTRLERWGFMAVGALAALQIVLRFYRP